MRAILYAAVAALLLVPAAAAEPLPVEPQHQDVYIDLMDCIWKGSYKEVASTPYITVWVYTCDSPDP